MKKALSLMFVALFGFFALSSTAVAKDAKISFGYILEKAADRIIVNEYDEENEDGLEITYVIDSSTKFENAVSLDDLSEYDDVEIQYTEEKGQRVAKVIAKDDSYMDALDSEE